MPAMLNDGVDGLDGARPPIVVIGSGPVGLALATALRGHGLPVLLLESGGEGSEAKVQELSSAERIEPERHDDTMIAMARQLGGTSNLWGARCLPYDPIDFETRPGIDAHWPIGAADLAPYWPAALRAAQSGAAVFEAGSPLLPKADADFSADRLERWANIQAAQVIHRQAIASDPGLDLRTHCTLVSLDIETDGRIGAIDVAHSLSGKRARFSPGITVLAMGGLETTRALLAAQRQAPRIFGGSEGPLGRHYMGHVIGEIADIVLADGNLGRAFDFHVDEHGSYVRRRFQPNEALQRQHGLMNSAFWPVVPPIADPRHGSATLSMVYLALSIPALGRLVTAEAIRRRHIPERPGQFVRHLANVLTGAPSALAFALRFFRDRYFGNQRLPGFFIRNAANRYGLSYHGEHAPSPSSRVWLGDARDRLGVPSLKIDLRFHDADIDSLLRTHDLLESWLTRNGVGHLEYRVPREERGAAIMAKAAHGTHQIGLARMGANRRDGIVDGNLRCFDSPNLYLATTAALPTSSQANPTLTAIALALRLADHLASLAGPPPARKEG